MALYCVLLTISALLEISSSFVLANIAIFVLSVCKRHERHFIFNEVFIEGPYLLLFPYDAMSSELQDVPLGPPYALETFVTP